ncbi:hypothetical protein [Phytohabitans rumicis]|uniref:Uncharacterized protein n=1 Tax=Phytohabitans rumicis TaxID=1076125 RepID=A0A6V8LCQ7_9ACTN|nr:hypothetical protein [Phytohabitans rumicis]GFJ95023.1 hypothetical protein Prum_086650 [Phytohabitans rumicis]
MMTKAREWQKLGLIALAAIVIVIVYSQIIVVSQPSSQAADITAVIRGVNPDNGAGLRMDVLVDVPVHLTGCEDTVKVKAIVSGTPQFWKTHGAQIGGAGHLGLALHTTYDGLRMLDWSGYDLPDALLNVYGPDQVPNPNRSGKVTFTHREDSTTGGSLYGVSIQDWASHRTPLVLEFDAKWTSPRSTGSCYLVLPELVAVESTAVGQARAGAYDAGSVFDVALNSSNGGEAATLPAAVTFGRVIVRTNGHIADGQSRPAPRLVDGNPWTKSLGEIGEEAGVWTCEPPASREQYPNAGVVSPDGNESSPPLDAAAPAGCGGLAVIEARNAGTVRDLGILLVGGLFSFVFGALLQHGVGLGGRSSKVDAKQDGASPPA